MLSLCQPFLSCKWSWIEFKEILGCIWTPMPCILHLYIKYLEIAMLSMWGRFNKKNKVRSIYFHYDVTSLKKLLDLFNVSPEFSRDVAPPNFTPIQDNKSDKSLKDEHLFIPHHKFYWFTPVFKTKTRFPSPPLMLFSML